MEAVQHWEQPDLLGVWAPPAEPAAPSPKVAKGRGGSRSMARAAPEVAVDPVAAEPVVADPVAAVVADPVVADPSAVNPVVSGLARAPAEGRIGPPLSLPPFSKAPPRDAAPALERLLILDTETTALHPKDGHCIEVGAVLFHVASRAVLTQVSFLLPCVENGAEAINGIPAVVSQLEQPWREALSCFLAMAAAADAILAHNAAFDRQWFGRGPLPALDKPWICSMDDIRWPPERHLRSAPSVRDLAIAYGVPVWAAHRALTDCIYLVQVLERCEDLERLLQAACEPRQLYRAQLNYNDRHQAKEAGFRWNEPVPGAWSKRLSEREAAALPFPVLPVAGH
ncbi:MAG: 3'-5' exonuclease [Cyanobacteriota bacterium]